MRKPLFVRDIEADSASDNIFVYRYMRWTSNTLYVLFTKRGVEFILCGKERIRNSSSIMNLSLSLDNDCRDMLSSSLNAIYLKDNESAIWEDLNISLDEGYDKVGYEWDGECIMSDRISRMRLFLDFVYELEQGNAFRQDPLFETICSTLHKHHLFNAIVNKLEYNDVRKRFENKWNDLLKDGAVQDELTLKEYKIDLRFLAEAERRWVEIIINPQSEMVFHESNWFKTEDIGEMDEVHINSMTLEAGRLLDEKSDKDRSICEIIRGSVRMSTCWYMSKYRLDGVLKIRLGDKAGFAIVGMSLSIILLSLIGVTYGLVYEQIMFSSIWRTTFMCMGLVLGLSCILSYMIPSLCKRNRR